jgi:tetratricopeptide (TPR) repeat protein
MSTDLSDQEIDLPPETPEEVYATLLRALRRKRGFGLFFVECSPQKGNELIAKLQQDLPQKTMQVLQLNRSSNTLYDRVEALWQEQPFDILFIQGLENALYEYEDTKRLAGWTSKDIYSYSWKGVPRILSHLNQQRERFRDNFICGFVFLVPYFVIKYFIQRAPDFFDWRSGLFIFPDQLEQLEQITSRVLESRDYDDYIQLTPAQRNEKLLLIDDVLRHQSHLTIDEQAELWREKGRLFHATNDYKAALNCYNRAVELKPDYHIAWFSRGNALLDLGCKEEAIASYDKVNQFKPDDHEVWNNRGLALSALGRREEAIASYDKVIELKPDYHIAWNNRGITFSALGRKEEAISSYDRAIELKPNYHIAWNNRGLALSALGRKEEAVSSHDKAIELKPDYHIAWNNRGITLYDLGRKEEAMSSFDRALELKPDWDKAYYNKACCYALMGDVIEAVNCLSRAIVLNPKYRETAKTDSDFDSIRDDERVAVTFGDSSHDSDQ